MDDDNVSMAQFAAIDAPFLGWHFPAKDEDGRALSTISRNWAGLGRELSVTLLDMRLTLAGSQTAASTSCASSRRSRTR